MTRRVLALFAVLPWAWSAAVAVLDRRSQVSLDDVTPAQDGPLVSVVVPARDEERGIRAAVASLAAQAYGPLEVIVVDDESCDGTFAEAVVAATDRVRVLRGAPVPDGWVGKSWACHQGYLQARGEWLLFTDADVRHAEDTVGRSLALVRRRAAEGLTLLPVIETDGLVERAVQPAAAVLIRSFVAPGMLVRSPRSRVAIAAGGFILVSRAAYEAVGGTRRCGTSSWTTSSSRCGSRRRARRCCSRPRAAACACGCTWARGRRCGAGGRTRPRDWGRDR